MKLVPYHKYMEENIPTLPSETQVITKKIIINHKTKILLLAVLILILAGLPSYYFYNQYQKAQALLQNPNLTVSQQEQDLVAKVGNLMVLPSNESPTIASVKDKTQLPDIPLFANVQNGDQILIYQKAQKAIVYRPSINKIIEVSPINLNSNSQTPVPTVQAQSPSPSVSPIASPSLTPTAAPQ